MDSKPRGCVRLLSTWKIPCLSVPPTKRTTPPLLGQSAQLHSNALDHLLFLSSSLRGSARALIKLGACGLSLLCATRFRFNHADGMYDRPKARWYSRIWTRRLFLVHRKFHTLLYGTSLNNSRDGPAVMTLEARHERSISPDLQAPSHTLGMAAAIIARDTAEPTSQSFSQTYHRLAVCSLHPSKGSMAEGHYQSRSARRAFELAGARQRPEFRFGAGHTQARQGADHFSVSMSGQASRSYV